LWGQGIDRRRRGVFVSILWIILIIVIVLALLGFLGRGAW
jgi:flagellar basal body-associated protein FliL